ncbi:MAG TPA: hypothetical protein VJ814_08660, partial [Gaiellaceae bacterium]|nr:hypothetical protein [Gaiellaceae bacterium]
PPRGVPGPFALADATQLGGLFTAAGFVGVDVREVPVALVDPTFDAYWTRTTALSHTLAELPDPVRQALRARVEERTRPYVGKSGLELPGLALLASGRLP